MPSSQRGFFSLLLAVGFAVLPPGAIFSHIETYESGADLMDRSGQTIPLHLSFRNEIGEVHSLKELMGKPAILTLNYYRCKSICTPMLEDLAKALDKVSLVPGKDYQVITLSIDPHETPEMAAEKKSSLMAPVKSPDLPAAWSFLTGKDAAIHRLAESVGYIFTVQGDGYLHPGTLVILSPQGKIIRYINGRQYLPLDIEMALTEASEGRVGQTIRKTLLTCFRYDPGQKRYVLDITRVSGALIILVAAIFLIILRKRMRHRSQGGDE